MKTRKMQFEPGGALGNTDRLVLLGSIDACQPRRKRHRGGLAASLFWFLLLATLAGAVWLIVDGFRRGVILTTLT